MIGYKKKVHPREADSFRSNDWEAFTTLWKSEWENCSAISEYFLKFKISKEFILLCAKFIAVLNKIITLALH